MICPQYARWFRFSLVFAVSHIATTVYAASLGDEILMAQIIPDDTLEDESSIVMEANEIDRIDGGAIRGGNLFHSFQDFNVNTGQQVYFVNPEGIETILSRVTGNNGSDIDGLLGVDGTADLFLLNPNGITFGPNAQLDIRGAFTASTAGTVEFADGSVFSAVNPQGASFLTMSVPLGVQFGDMPQGNIASTGVLETGQDLTLLGSQLYLEGQLIAGGSLTLQAQDTVTIRDTETDAFIARSGDDLTIQGNQGIDIWTLQHLEQIPFVSGGDLILISDGEISGDAHFESGGSLQFLTLASTPGNFVSFHDPIIFADGDVVFGDYTGVALKVETTGSIEAGDIVITGPDTTLIADGSGSDEDLLASSPAAILRAGVDSVDNPNIPQTTGGTIVEAGNIAERPPGSIVVNSIDTSGGPIVLVASGNIFSPGSLISRGRGGAISISAGGRIDIDSVRPNSSREGGGGPISIFSRGDIDIDSLTSLSALSNTGVSDDIQSLDSIEKISISSEGNIDIGELSLILLEFTKSSNSTTNIGDTGEISISSGGNINIDLLRSGSLGLPRGSNNIVNLGNGGEILISSEGNINIGEMVSFSYGRTNNNLVNNNIINVGNGGDISISSGGNIDIDGSLGSASFGRTSNNAINVGNGGDISISSGGNININGSLSSYSFSKLGTIGDSGAISLAADGIILGDNAKILAISVAELGLAGAGGEITLEANNISGLEVATLSSAGQSGNVNIQNLGGNLIATDVTLTTSAQLELSFPIINETIIVNIDNIGQSGNALITSAGDLTLNNLQIQGNANGSRPAGNVTISSPDQIVFNNSQLLSNTNARSSGEGGDISILDADVVRLNNTQVFTSSDGSGDAGDIVLQGVGLLLLRQNSLIQAGASAIGDGGNVDIDAGLILAVPNENNDILADTNSGTGGEIDITAERIIGFREVENFSPNLRNNNINDISARSEQGVDGEISINNLAVDPNQGLTELSADITDPTNRIAQGCSTEDTAIADSPTGDFIITGRGGQPLSPVDIGSEDAPLHDLGPDTAQSEPLSPEIDSSSPINPQFNQLTDSQSAVVTESGDVFLSAEGDWQPSVSCAALGQTL